MDNLPAAPNPRHEIFAAEYVANGGNGTKAMMAAEAGLSEESAAVASSRLLRNDRVNRLIEQKLRAALQKTDSRVEEVLLELARILRTDVAEAIDPDTGAFKPIHEIPVDLRRAIASIEVDEIWETENDGGKRKKIQVGETKKVKFWSKTEAAKMLGQYLKMWVERTAGIEASLGIKDGKVSYTLTVKT